MKRSSNSRIWAETRTRIAISASECPLALQRLDLLADQAGLFLAVPGAVTQLLAVLVVGVQRLAQPALVVGDQMRGGGEDMAGGAIVALEPDDDGAREILLEAQDVVHLGAAPAIDRLVVVADAADVLAALAPAAAARDTARRWCPGTRRPGCSGSAAGSRPARPDSRGRGGGSRAAGRRNRRRSAASGAPGRRRRALPRGRSAKAAASPDGHLVRRQAPVLPAVDHGGQRPGRASASRRCRPPGSPASSGGSGRRCRGW